MKTNALLTKSYTQQTDEQRSAVQQIFSILYKKHGVDFAKYKTGTVSRRLSLKISRSSASDLEEYKEHLIRNPVEIDSLFESLLIPVTSFFREKKTFHALNCDVLPLMISRLPSPKNIRIWVPGCSTGEEVYSIAICLMQNLKTNSDYFDIRIFGTDVNPTALKEARSGFYLKSRLKGVSNSQLKRYFKKESGGFKICDSIRRLCVFARQNLLEDPPFLHLNIISCQNVLIYFNKESQMRVFNWFASGLNYEGCLILGKAETLPVHFSGFQKCQRGIPIYVKTF